MIQNTHNKEGDETTNVKSSVEKVTMETTMFDLAHPHACSIYQDQLSGL